MSTILRSRIQGGKGLKFLIVFWVEFMAQKIFNAITEKLNTFLNPITSFIPFFNYDSRIYMLIVFIIYIPCSFQNKDSKNTN